MVEWWNTLDTLVKMLYCITIPATLILVIQTIMSMLSGMGGGAGIDGSDISGMSDGGDFSFDASDMGDLADPTDISDLNGAQEFTDGGNPADFSTLRFFTLQGVVAFLTVFGWSSIASITAGAPVTISVLMGIGFGLIAMLAVAKLVQLSSKLTENGTVNMKNAIGQTGSVYIPIPAKGKGEGKLNMYLQGSLMECSAVTDGENSLSTGTAVRVVNLRNGCLVVEEDN